MDMKDKKKSKSLKWCFNLKDGLKLSEPNLLLSLSYMEQAKSSLLRSAKDIEDNDLLWATVAAYYAEYYALCSFMQRIGVRGENHFCAIILASVLLGEDNVKTISDHKEKRIGAQYFMKVDKEREVRTMLTEAGLFVARFEEIMEGMSEKEIKDHRLLIYRFLR